MKNGAGCDDCLPRLHQFRQTWDELPAPETITPVVSEQTRIAYADLKAAWTLYRALLSEDCMDHGTGQHGRAAAAEPGSDVLEEIGVEERGKRLTPVQKDRVRELAREGKMSQTAIGQMFGITSQRVSQIKTNYQPKAAR